MTSFSSSANPNDAHSTKIQVGSQQHNIRQSLRNCAPLSHSPAQEWHDVLLQLMMSSSEAHSPPTLYTTPTVARWKPLFWNLIEPEWFPCTLFLANFCMVASHFLATPGWTLPRLDRRPQWAQSMTTARQLIGLKPSKENPLQMRRAAQSKSKTVGVG